MEALTFNTTEQALLAAFLYYMIKYVFEAMRMNEN